MAAHPDTELIPYVHGELPAPERERVAQHLRGCLDCRRDADELRELLDDLGRAVPRPPDVHWGGYRAELREKLAAHRTRRAWWARPVPLALSASLASLLLVVAFLAVQSARQSGTGADFASVEEAAIGDRLGLLAQYPGVERLVLPWGVDLVNGLPRPPPGRGGQ